MSDSFLAYALFTIAFALTMIGQRFKAEKKPSWIILQMAGTGIGLVSVYFFYKIWS